MNNLINFFSQIKLKLEINPTDLRQLLEFFEGSISADKDKLALLIHLIMVKNHFQFGDTYELNQTKDVNNFNKLNYNLIRTDNKLDTNQSVRILLCSNLIIVLLKSGRATVDIQLKYKSFLTRFLKINLELSLFDSQMKLNEFERSFKDSILLPFKAHVKLEILNDKKFLKAENPLSLNSFYTGLNDLPIELLIFRLVLRFLNIESIVALCKANKFVHKVLSDQITSNSVWKFLVLRDYKNVDLTNVNNFRNKYVEQYLILKRFHRYRF